jgi:6-phosphofructokinase
MLFLELGHGIPIIPLCAVKSGISGKVGNKYVTAGKWMQRIFVVELMGWEYGYIALQVALADGCEEVLVPEKDYDIDNMCE